MFCILFIVYVVGTYPPSIDLAYGESLIIVRRLNGRLLYLAKPAIEGCWFDSQKGKNFFFATIVNSIYLIITIHSFLHTMPIITHKQK